MSALVHVCVFVCACVFMRFCCSYVLTTFAHMICKYILRHIYTDTLEYFVPKYTATDITNSIRYLKLINSLTNLYMKSE